MTSQPPPAPRRPDLVAFAERILEDWPGWWSFIGAADVQAIALECGLLERVTVTEPCGESCQCAEYHDFNGQAVECYRRVDLREATKRAPSGRLTLDDRCGHGIYKTQPGGCPFCAEDQRVAAVTGLPPQEERE